MTESEFRDAREASPDHAALDRNAIARTDRGILLDKDDDDWAWRRKIRSHPPTARLYRALVFVVGLVLVLGGLALVPLPGPGWVIVIAGIAIWASEFEKAQALQDFVRDKLRAWNVWMRAQPLWVQALGALATAAFVLAVIWLALRLTGVPGFLPDGIERFLRLELALD